jgi:hypothetical protein
MFKGELKILFTSLLVLSNISCHNSSLSLHLNSKDVRIICTLLVYIDHKKSSCNCLISGRSLLVLLYCCINNITLSVG